MDYKEHLKTISLDGGLLCLDFINTVSDYTETPILNYLQGEEEWIAWLCRVGLITDDDQIFQQGTFHLDHILEVRNMLYKIFTQHIHQRIIPTTLLAKFNKQLHWVNRHIKLTIHNGHITEIFDYDNTHADNYLIPIIKSARDILVSDQLKNVRECGNCGWLFYDKSKNQTRRWCNMKVCGNKIKTQKYYRKSVTVRKSQEE